MIMCFLSISSFASTNANMIWEKNTKDISASVSGPVAMGIGTIAIVVAALGWAITDGGSMTGKAIRIVLALTIAGVAGTLDKKDNSVRKYLGERCELLGAVRLPNSVFKGVAGTEVTQIYIVFKEKR